MTSYAIVPAAENVQLSERAALAKPVTKAPPPALLTCDERPVVAGLLPPACRAQSRFISLEAPDAGDLRARDRLFDVLQPVLWGFARNHSVPSSSRADFVQDINVLVLEALPGFRGEPGLARFTTWLYSVARHHAIDLWRRRFARRRTRRLRPEDESVPDGGDGPLAHLARAEDRQHTLAAMRDLREQAPENQCRALQMRMVDGLSVKEIGGILQATPDQASS